MAERRRRVRTAAERTPATARPGCGRHDRRPVDIRPVVLFGPPQGQAKAWIAERLGSCTLERSRSGWSLQPLHHRRERAARIGLGEQKRQSKRKRQNDAGSRQEPAERIDQALLGDGEVANRAEEPEDRDPHTADRVDRSENPAPRARRQDQAADQQRNHRDREQDAEDLLDRREVTRDVGAVGDHQRVRRALRRAARQERRLR